MNDLEQINSNAAEVGEETTEIIPTQAFDAAGQAEGNREISRGIAVITDEIIFYKNVGGNAIIEIGKRLIEAKAQLSHGEWLPWLREKVDFSERNAQNFMRIAKAYRNAQTIADLGASKALALLALPDSERENFTEEKHVVNGEEKSVQDMTGAELRAAIQARDKAMNRAAEAEKNLDSLTSDLSNAKQEAEALKEQLRTAQENTQKLVDAEIAKVDALKVKSDGLAEKLKTAREKEKDAQAAAEAAKKELEELKAKPVEVAVQQPSGEELDKLRAKAEEAAAEKVKEANARLMEAQARAETAEAEAQKAQAALKLSDQKVAVFQVFYNEWQKLYASMVSAMKQVEDGETAEKLKKAVRAAAERMAVAE